MSELLRVVMIANDDHPVPEWVAQRLGAAGIAYGYRQCYTRADLAACASEAHVLWLNSSRRGLVTEEHMDLFPEVGAVLKVGSGTDNVDREACTRRGIIIAHTPDDPTESTSDHTVAMLLTAVRQTAHQDRLVRAGHWDMRLALPVGPLTAAELGVIGFGRIARMVIRKLSGFRMEVRVFDPHVSAGEIEAAGARPCALDELLRASRYVIIACPLTDETRGMIGREPLALMRRDAVLINCARAGIADEHAVITALQEKRLAAAAFDVLSSHPLTPESPWLTVPNATLTPHMGGCAYDYPDGIYPSQIEVLADLARGVMPRWVANRGVVPRWPLRPREES